MSSRSLRSREAKIGTDRLSKNRFFSSCSYNSQLASWNLQLSCGGRRTVDGQRSVHQRSAKSGLCCFLPKAALRPRTLFRALRPGVIFASLASADAFRRLASNQLASLPPAIFRRITSSLQRASLPTEGRVLEEQFFLAFAFITCSVTLATDGLLGER
jgi:hypothetical protein